MGTCILYWGTLEWVYYYTAPPMGLEPESIAAAQVVLSYNFFHWGIPAWGIYAIGTVPIAYRYYVRKQSGLSLAGGCEGVTRGNPILDKLINIVFIFGIISGMIYIISFPAAATFHLNQLRLLIVDKLGVYFILVTMGVFIVNIVLAFSKYGQIDHGKP